MGFPEVVEPKDDEGRRGKEGGRQRSCWSGSKGDDTSRRGVELEFGDVQDWLLLTMTLQLFLVNQCAASQLLFRCR